jgi:glycine betaine/choline ABC-type transport system substrate-binding protein
MQYKIVDGNSRYDLQTKVCEEIKYGWKPQGGVSFLHHSGFRETWAQAMVKEK